MKFSQNMSHVHVLLSEPHCFLNLNIGPTHQHYSSVDLSTAPTLHNTHWHFSPVNLGASHTHQHCSPVNLSVLYAHQQYNTNPVNLGTAADCKLTIPSGQPRLSSCWLAPSLL